MVVEDTKSLVVCTGLVFQLLTHCLAHYYLIFSKRANIIIKSIIVAGNKHSVLGGPNIKLYLLSSERNRRTECGHTVFGSDRIKASVSTKARIFHNRIKRNYRCSAVAVKPRAASFLYVFIMSLKFSLMTCGLKIFSLWVYLTNSEPPTER